MGEERSFLRVRTYGTSGPVVFVLHGGPAAVGEAAPIAKALSASFRTIEPFQRGSGDLPLTVAQHVEDLDQLVRLAESPCKPAIVGESWGAMLALAYAAEHGNKLSALVLVGCGTFDEISRAQLDKTVKARTVTQCLTEDGGSSVRAVYDFDPDLPDGLTDAVEPFDHKAHTETWHSMLDAQERGIYPAAFTSIQLPVLMIHGSYDPHPGDMIHQVLRQYMPQIEYCELRDCGHSPWKERRARGPFFGKISAWLMARFSQTFSPAMN